MAFNPMTVAMPLLGGLSGLFGGGSSTQTTTPTMGLEYRGIQDMLLRLMQRRLASGSLPAGYETGGIRSINNTAKVGSASLANMLAARGLSRSPVAANVLSQADLGRTGQIADFETNLPILQRQLQSEDAGLGMNLMNFGRGSETTGSGPSGPAAGFQSMTDMLAFLYGKNPASFSWNPM